MGFRGAPGYSLTHTYTAAIGWLRREGWRPAVRGEFGTCEQQVLEWALVPSQACGDVEAVVIVDGGLRRR